MNWPCKKYGECLGRPGGSPGPGYRHLLRLCLLTIPLLLFSCGRGQEPPLSVGTIMWAGFEPLYLARSLGYYDNTGIRLVELTSATEVMHALRNGTLEVAALTLDEVLSLIDEGVSLKVILVVDYSNGGDVLLGKPEFTAVTDLRGKRIALEYSAVGAILLDSALDSAGMQVAEVEIVACTPDEHLSCYGEADAVVTFEPAKTQILDLGARQLFDSSQIPGKIVDVLVVPDQVVLSHTRSLEQLLSGYFRARQYLDDNLVDASQRMASRLGLAPDQVPSIFEGIRLTSLQENRILLDPDKAPLQHTANELAGFMLQKRLLKNPLTIEQLLDDRFLPQGVP